MVVIMIMLLLHTIENASRRQRIGVLTPTLYKMFSSILVCSKSLVFATNMFSFIMYVAIYMGVYKLTSDEYIKQITI